PVGLSQPTTFGEDPAGELWVADLGGTVSKLVTPPPPTVSVGDKAILEGDAGTRSVTFPVTLSEPSTTNVTVHYAVTGAGATGGTKPGGVDLAPGATLGVADVSVVQQVRGAQSLAIPVTISRQLTGTTTVHYTITPGSASYSAKKTGGGEFGGKLSGILSFPANATTKTIT